MKNLFITILIVILSPSLCQSQCHKMNNKDIKYTFGRPSKMHSSGFMVSGPMQLFVHEKLISKLCHNVDTLINELQQSDTKDFAALLTLFVISSKSPRGILSFPNTVVNDTKIIDGYYIYDRKLLKQWRKYYKANDIKLWTKWRDTHTKNGKIIKKSD